MVCKRLPVEAMMVAVTERSGVRVTAPKMVSTQEGGVAVGLVSKGEVVEVLVGTWIPIAGGGGDGDGKGDGDDGKGDGDGKGDETGEEVGTSPEVVVDVLNWTVVGYFPGEAVGMAALRTKKESST